MAVSPMAGRAVAAAEEALALVLNEARLGAEAEVVRVRQRARELPGPKTAVFGS